MPLHLFPCRWSKIFCTHTIISLIQLLSILVTTGDNLILFMRIGCTLSKHKQKLCLSVSLILKSCIFTNATLEIIQVIKTIFTIAYTIFPLKVYCSRNCTAHKIIMSGIIFISAEHKNKFDIAFKSCFHLSQGFVTILVMGQSQTSPLGTTFLWKY